MQILTFRLSVFGDFNSYVPTTERILKWMQEFQRAGYNFLPSIIQGQPLTIAFPMLSVQPSMQDKRIQFSSPNNNIFVRFLAERLDVEYTLGQSDDLKSYFMSNIKEACSIMNISLGMLDCNVLGNRLAYYTDVLLDKCDEEALNTFYSNNIDVTLDNFEGKYLEWSHRFNKRISVEMSAGEELVNTILLMEAGTMHTINQTTGEQEELKGLHVVADINTIAENTLKRFESTSANEFYSHAQNIYINMLEQVYKNVKKTSENA